MDLAIDQKSLTNQSFSDRVDAITFDALFQTGKQFLDNEKFKAAEKSFSSAKQFGSSPQLSELSTQAIQKLKEQASSQTNAEEPLNDRP